jgi:predicted solute-binding protein
MPADALTKQLTTQQFRTQSGGASKRTISESEINEYLDGQRIMYGSGAKKSKKLKKFTRKRNHKKQKQRKTKKRRRSRK